MLLSQFDSRIRCIARSFRVRSSDRDDLVQIGRMAFLAAAKRYQPDASLWAYAKERVVGAMADHLRRERRRQPVESVEEVEGDPLDAPDLFALVCEALSALTEDERDLVSLYAEGLSCTQIGLRTHRHERSVRRALDRALERMRAAAGDDSAAERSH